MSRENLVMAVVKAAENLGWEAVEADDAGTTVTLLLSAPGATEQMVEGAPHKLPKLLKDLGGPENYPAVEEYEVLRAEFEHVVEHHNIVPASSAAEAGTIEEEVTAEEASGLHEDPESGFKADNGLEVARAFNGAKKAAIQIGDQVWVVTGMGIHSGPFRREFDDEDRALDFAQKCQLKAVSKRYADTIRVEYPA